MRLQDKETYRHRVIGFFQYRMFAAEEFGQFDHIIVTLAHLPAIDGDHIVVDPVTDRCHMIADRTLGNFTFMVREQQIHTAAMYIKLGAEVFSRHG